ncbi:MAG: rhomboid family intramembrane serine protease [Bacteroidales bacterium]|nr:rhomboid family intramembrane serine protease [Bacteroidales bacterium]MBS3773834.1 rhomboid family intramembrane serine protease [Bacteroidales bacterium]
MGIADQIRDTFKRGSSLIKLIYINVAVFLGIKVIQVLAFLFGFSGVSSVLVHWLSVPAELGTLVTRPWTLLTYMFLHEGFFHIAFNLLWLYVFGRIFLMYLNEKKLLSVYLVGGFAGAALYILSFNVFPAFQDVVTLSFALGASASVMAIVIAISVYVPDFSINLLLLGPVKLKYIAIFTIVLDVLSIPTSNSGGHIAHLGGALFGYLYIRQYRKGKIITKGFDHFMDELFALFKPRPKFKVTHKQHKPKTDIEYNREKAKRQQKINKILEKISKKGYESLTKEEKELLFKAGGGKDQSN